MIRCCGKQARAGTIGAYLGELEEGAMGERCLALWGEVEVEVEVEGDVRCLSKSSLSLSLGRRAGV